MDVLIVVDMQNDFIDGALGSKMAQTIVENVNQKVKEAEENGKVIIFTKDTHYENYLDTEEERIYQYLIVLLIQKVGKLQIKLKCQMMQTFYKKILLEQSSFLIIF